VDFATDPQLNRITPSLIQLQETAVLWALVAPFRQLDRVISALRELSRNSTPTRRRKRRGMSAAARRKIVRAQKVQWVKWRQARRTKR